MRGGPIHDLGTTSFLPRQVRTERVRSAGRLLSSAVETIQLSDSCHQAPAGRKAEACSGSIRMPGAMVEVSVTRLM